MMPDIEVVNAYGDKYMCVVNGEIAFEGTERACEQFGNELYEQIMASKKGDWIC